MTARACASTRPVRDEQPDQYREQHEIDGATEPSTGVSFCRILTPQRLSRRGRSRLPRNYATRTTACPQHSHVLLSGPDSLLH